MSTMPPPSAAPGQGNNAARRPRRRGSLLPLGIALLGVLELTILIAIGWATNLWWPLLIVALGWIIGFALVVAAGQQSFVRLRSLVRAVRGRGDVEKHLSRPAFTLLAAVCFFFPGVITDVIGLVLLVTPVQRRAVSAMGLGSASEASSRVLYRRSNAGVIDGEIIVHADPVRRPGEGSDKDTGKNTDGGPHPPLITQS